MSLSKRIEVDIAIRKQLGSDLKTETEKCRKLNASLVKAEDKLKEVQRKYEESNRAYYRVRDDRERLKVQIE